MTPEQVRWGLENLNLTQAKLDAPGLQRRACVPSSTSCARTTWAPTGPRIDHGTAANGRSAADWMQADEQIIKPMVKANAPPSTPTRKS